MERRRLVLAAALIGTLAGGVAPVASASPTPPSAVVRVMTLNIFYRGDELDLQTGNFSHKPAGCPETLAQVGKVIGESDADIVAIEEGEHNAGVIAQALGWHASERTQVISRYPIVDPPGGNGRMSGSRCCPAGSSRSATSTCCPTRTGRTRSAMARRSTRCSTSRRPSGCPRSRPSSPRCRRLPRAACRRS